MSLPLPAARLVPACWYGVLALGALAAVAPVVAPSALAAQPAPAVPAVAPVPSAGAPTLTVEEAIALARRNSPVFLQSANQQRRADAALRSATGNLVPSLGTGFGTTYREGRQQFFAGQSIGAQADQVSSSLGLDVQASYSVATLTAPRVQRANAEAVRSDVRLADAQLRRDVTVQYLAALQAEATAALQDSLIRTAQAQLELAQARVAVGSATPLDVKRAEVALGQQRVNALTARQTAFSSRLDLFRTIGVTVQEGAQLTSRFPLELPEVEAQSLTAEALRRNPALEATRTREDAAQLGIRSARGQYLPSLSFQAGVSGFGNRFMSNGFLVQQELASRQGLCRQTGFVQSVVGQPFDPASCNAISLAPAEVSAARARNPQLFDYSRNPYQLSLQLSLPIFNGFTREQQVQEAIATRNDAEYRRRQQELQVQNDMALAPRQLRTTREVVQVQAQNSVTAKEALQLAEERYRVGLGTFIDVAQARDEFARAQTSYINAVYDYHRAIAALEFTLGRALR
jgi:outer membrane protein